MKDADVVAAAVHVADAHVVGNDHSRQLDAAQEADLQIMRKLHSPSCAIHRRSGGVAL